MNNDPRYNPPPGGVPYPPQPPMQQPYPGQPLQYTQYPGQPPMQPQQQPPRKGKKRWIGLGIIVGAVVLCGLFATGFHSNPSDNSTTTAASSSSDSSSSQQSTPPKPQSWTTTHTYSGDGRKKTETIPVGSDWKIQWSCTPGSFSGFNYNVIVGVYNSDATPADPVAINAMCKTGSASGETEEHTSGNIYLDVNSEGSWSVTIQELK